MKVETNAVVTLAYKISRQDGELVESSEQGGPISFTHGQGAILKGLDDRLDGMEPGQEATFEFPPEQAFGRLEDAPQKTIPRAEFPEAVKLEPGVRLEAGIPGGQRILLEVIDLQKDTVSVRMIHPLAGQKISMWVKVLGVRLATVTELERGVVLNRPPPLPPGR